MISVGKAIKKASRVLVADGDPKTRAVLSRVLARGGREVVAVSDGEGARDALREGNFSLAVLNHALDRVAGERVLVDLRRFSDTPVVMTSEDPSSDAAVLALELGADAYVRKPYSPFELAAVVAAVERRCGAVVADVEELGLGARIDYVSHEVEVGGEDVSLSRSEYLLLAYLARSSLAEVSRADLALRALGEAREDGDRRVDSMVCSLRRKLGPAGDLVETVPGGYRLVCRD